MRSARARVFSFLSLDGFSNAFYALNSIKIHHFLFSRFFTSRAPSFRLIQKVAMFTLTLTTIYSNRKRDINLYDDNDDGCVCIFVMNAKRARWTQTTNYLMYSVCVYDVTVEVARGMR